MIHSATARFWVLYDALPKDMRETADKNFQLLKADPRHPSVHFKRIGAVWSVRIGDRFRDLGHDTPDGIQ